MNRYIALLKVLELGSYTKAAEALGYTQPALSQMITSLEKETGITLLFRSRSGIRLTPDGERLLPLIQTAVLQYEALRRAECEINGLATGIVRIGTVSSVSCHWLPQVIRQFWTSYPDIQLVLHQGDYTSICDWVQTGAVDFGFVNPAAVNGLETTFLKTDPVVAVLPIDHPLAEKDVLSLDDLTAEPYLLLEEGRFSEPLDAFHRAGLHPNIRLTMHDDYSILSMVEQGLGYSLLADLVLKRTDYHVAVRPLQEPILRTMSLVTKNKKALSLAARTFSQFIIQNITSFS